MGAKEQLVESDVQLQTAKQDRVSLRTIFEYIIGNAIWRLPFVECERRAADQRYGHGSQRNKWSESHRVVFGYITKAVVVNGICVCVCDKKQPAAESLLLLYKRLRPADYRVTPFTTASDERFTHPFSSTKPHALATYRLCMADILILIRLCSQAIISCPRQ